METLNVFEELNFDHTIQSKTIRSYNPFDVDKLGQSEVIRIQIQNQDGYTLPCESFLYIKGTIANKANNAIRDKDVINNAFAFLFDEIRYEINSVEIDVTRNVGLTSLVKGLLSFSESSLTRLQNSGWLRSTDTATTLVKEKNFDVAIPLSMLLGFFEDYQNVLMGARQELILIRSRTDANCLVLDAAPKDADAMPVIKLKTVQWQMPHIKVSDEANAPLLQKMSKGMSASMPFRSWNLHERPNLSKTSPITWTVKTCSQTERPSYVIVFFQTNRGNDLLKNMSKFDHCSVRYVRLYLNSEYWPHDTLSVDFAKGQVSQLYEMYAKFQQSYYGKDPEPILSRKYFLENNPMWMIDCSNQPRPLKLGGVDIKIEINASAEIPDNTSAFCLIIHDKIVKITPLTSDVRREL